MLRVAMVINRIDSFMVSMFASMGSYTSNSWAICSTLTDILATWVDIAEILTDRSSKSLETLFILWAIIFIL